jgi:tetratricopeptide (TPR) repeat protein
VIDRELDDLPAEAWDLNSLGLAHIGLGDLCRATELFEQALAIAQEVNDSRNEGECSWNLGIAYERQAHLARAAELMQVYVDYLRELGHPEAEKRAAYVAQLRQRLAASQNPPPADASDEG